MDTMLEYLLGDGQKYETIGLRPGEKMHECLITKEEQSRGAQAIPGCVRILPPTTTYNNHSKESAYTSDAARKIERDEFGAMIASYSDDHAR
jgi:FlaA1/EpsC-like NDP-sugar epimerase